MADWQNQNFKKTGATEAAPCTHNPKIHPSGIIARMNSKIATPTYGMGGLVLNQKMSVAHYADGGLVNQEAADKTAGLEASKNDKVSFFDRLRMGNIDEQGSEAYNRFGAGRAKSDRDEKSEAAANKTVDEYQASIRDQKSEAAAMKAVDDARPSTPVSAAAPKADTATAEAQPYKADESASLSRLAASRTDTTSSMKEPKAVPTPASAAKRVAKSMVKAVSEGDDESARTASASSKSIMNPQTGFQLVKDAPKPEPTVIKSPAKTYASSGRNPGVNKLEQKPEPTVINSPAKTSFSSGRNPG